MLKVQPVVGYFSGLKMFVTIEEGLSLYDVFKWSLGQQKESKMRAIQLYLLAFIWMTVNRLIKLNSTEHSVNI
jgi:hypothetical protein